MKIIVESEEVKQEIIKQSKYISDFIINVDTIKEMKKPDSNTLFILMHLYLAPQIIQVDSLTK